MSSPDDKLKEIAASLDKGVAPAKESIRSFLWWFGSARRGFRASRAIRARLLQHGIQTVPDFQSTHIDAQITFEKISKAEIATNDTLSDPTPKVARLVSANRPPVSVKPDSTIQHIVTTMLTQDYSQLPVMTSTREVKGIVSWKSLGSRLALQRPCAFARDCMDTHSEVYIDDSLFSVISKVSECDYVLVRAKDGQVCGIVTASDLTEQFRKLAEPFLLIGEIENGIRRILHGKFSTEDLSSVKSPDDKDRKIEAISDLTFGEYIRLLETPPGWKKAKLAVDKVEFTKRLHSIREIRNDVMHFDPDGLDDEDLKELRDFASFLKRLRDMGAA